MKSIRVTLTVSFAGALVLGYLGPVPVAQAATITPTVFTDDNTDNGNCTLREAIIAANTDAADDACTAGSGADQITLAAGTYELSVGPAGDDAAANGDLDITDPDGLTITGDPAGSAVDANGIDRVFDVRGGGNATFDLLTITGGDATGFGGGIFVQGGGTANVANTTLTGNIATEEGGAIDVLDAGTTLNLTDSAIVANAATGVGGDGGGIEYDNNTTANVTNTTFSGNTAADTGGAVETEGGTGNFLNSTITNNSAPNQGGIVQSQLDGTVNLKGTILAGNSVTGTAPECNAVTSQGHNLIGDPTGCTITGQQATDITGQTPLLGPLADNGGPTQSHALLKGSPAIDAGGTDCAPTDQRGLPRSACDIGAYELVLCGKVPVNLIGTAGNDALTGTPGPDGLLGLAGKDLLRGKAGKDGLCGGPGKDTLKGGGGNDRLDGGPGKDICVGQAGRDKAKACEREKSL